MDAIILKLKNGESIIKSEEGVVFNPNAGEEQDAFVERVADALYVESGEATNFVDIDEVKTKKKATKQLQSAINKADNMAVAAYYMDLIGSRANCAEEAPLTQEEIDAKLEEATEAPAAKKPATKKPAAKKPAAKKPAAKKPAKAPRVKKEKPSDAAFEAATEEAKPNVGKKIKFIPNGADEAITGRIRGIMRDKRVNFVYYRIQIETDKGPKILHKHAGVDEIIKIS